MLATSLFQTFDRFSACVAQNDRGSNARTNRDGHVGDQPVPVLGAAAVALHGGSAVGGQVPTTVVVSFPRHGTVVAGPACTHAGPRHSSLASRRLRPAPQAALQLVLDAALSCGDVSLRRQLAAP